MAGKHDVYLLYIGAYPRRSFTIKPVTPLATGCCGIPSRIGLENSVWRDTNGARPVEPITSDAGLSYQFG
jgi:hypothetical protein